MEHVLLMVLNRIHVFVQQIILVLDVKYAIAHVLFIHVGPYWLLLLLEFNFVLGLNGGVCQSTINGGVICTCPAGYTGVRWYVVHLTLVIVF